MKEELKDLILENVSTDDTFESSYDLYEHLDYSGSVLEIIDSNIDIYNSDLRQWAVDNYHFIEEAMEEGLTSDKADFHQLIQAGQYVAYSAEAQRLVEDLFEECEGTLFNVTEAA